VIDMPAFAVVHSSTTGEFRSSPSKKPKATTAPLTPEAAAIKAALKRLGMTQADLAQQLGVSAALVTRWMKPTSDPRWAEISPKHLKPIQELLKL
jgi:DNA-binding transcriptional regulator YiaG